ncbi:MAG TPA: hypothetical protein VGJ16_00050 [Pirellulales bacterium]|jgi:hypothetical protein
MTAPRWQLEDDLARLRFPRVQAELALAAPEGGLGRMSFGGSPVEGLRLLALSSPTARKASSARLVESFGRGGDLIARYADWPEMAMQAQLAWRTASPSFGNVLAGVEMVISVETSLLDSCPTMAIVSQVPAQTALNLPDQSSDTFAHIDATRGLAPTAAAGCYLFRLDNLRCSLVQAVHPVDAPTNRLEQSPRSPGGEKTNYLLRHELFAAQLEKGVILRARVLAALIEREADEAAAKALYKAFLDQPLPLTA